MKAELKEINNRINRQLEEEKKQGKKFCAIQELDSKDGTEILQVRVEGGEVFKGSPRDVIESMSQALMQTKRWGQALREKVQELVLEKADFFETIPGAVKDKRWQQHQ